MRFAIPALVVLAIGLGAAQAQAQSCSTFLTIKSYDKAANTAQVDFEKGNQKKYFPKPDGANTDSTKIPKKCAKRITRNNTLNVTPTGGRMSVTQLRSNFEGKMQNDLDDPAWLPNHLAKLIESKTEVVAVIRPGKKQGEEPELTTIYLPITDAEKKEIARINAQAEEVAGEELKSDDSEDEE